MPSFKWQATNENSVINEKNKLLMKIMKNSTILWKQSKNAGSNSQLSSQLNQFQLISQLNKITDSLTDWINKWMNNKKSIKEVMIVMHWW